MCLKSTLCIPLPDPFSFKECSWFLNRNYDDCLHRADENLILKAISLDDRIIVLSIWEENGHLFAEAVKGDIHVDDEERLRNYISEWFDLGRDLKPFYKLLRKDKKLAYMAGEYNGLRMMGISDMFEALCWSVIGQQINLSFAYRLKRRLVERYGRSLEYNGETHYLFPDAETLAVVQPQDLRDMQFSSSKASYLTGIARAFSNNDISKGLIKSLETMEARQRALLALKGVGIWTANYVLMKTFREPAGIPYGDVGLLNALTRHGIIKDRSDLTSMDKMFKRYAGWESYLVFYLWRSLAVS